MAQVKRVEEIDLLKKFENVMQIINLRISLRDTYQQKHPKGVIERRDLSMVLRELARSDNAADLVNAEEFHKMRYIKEKAYFEQKYA